MKRISVSFIILFSLLCLIPTVFCQTNISQDRKIYSYQNIHENHPDGVVGKLSTTIGTSFTSITNQAGQPVVDATKMHARLGWVFSDKFSESQSFTVYKEFETTYQLSAGFKYYLSNPLTKNATVNPDGKTGSPIISVNAIMFLDNLKATKSTTNFKAELLVPLSPSYSIFGGYTSYEKINKRDVEKIYGGLHIFLSRYKSFENFQNPDSPLDGFAIILKGGNSEFGSFGELQFAIPSSQSVTIDVTARGDFLEAPFDKSYTGSLQISYYTGK